MSRIGDLFLENKFIKNTLLAKKQMEAASFRKLQKPSDNPFDVARVVVNRFRYISLEEYENNIKFIRPNLEYSEKVMGDIFTDIITRARQLAIRGDGLLTPEEAANIAEEVKLLKKNLLDYANAQFTGKYIFSGSSVNVKPFTFAYSQGITTKVFSNDYNVDVLSTNSVALDDTALSEGDTLTFRIGNDVVYVKALKDMTLQEVIDVINSKTDEKNIPAFAYASPQGDGTYKLLIRSGEKTLSPEDVELGSILGSPDYPHLALEYDELNQTGDTFSFDFVKNGTTTTISVTATKDMGLKELADELNKKIKENGILAEAVITRTKEGGFYLRIISGDPEARIENLTDEGGRIISTNHASYIINDPDGKAVYLGDYKVFNAEVDESTRIEGNVILANEITQLWDVLSELEGAVLSKSGYNLTSTNAVSSSTTVLANGKTFKFSFAGTTVELTNNSGDDWNLDEFLKNLNEKIKEYGLELEARVYESLSNPGYFGLKLYSLDPNGGPINIIQDDTVFAGNYTANYTPSDFISDVIGRIDEISQSLNAKRIEVGNALSRLEYYENLVNEKKTKITEIDNELENVDLAEAMASITKYQNIYQMNLLLLSKSQSISLLDFMR
ncbi:flagellin [Desulfurobacterium crinifex]